MNYGCGYFVRFVSFPSTIRAVTLPNDDGTFDIYINQTLPYELQLAAFKHELNHIQKDHFYVDECCIAQIEKEAG